VITPNFPDWETITYLNSHLTGQDRVLAQHATSPLYIRPQLLSGNWGDRRALDMISDPAQLADVLREHNIGYILVYPDSPAGRALYTSPAFLAAHAEMIYSGPRTQLYAIR
jgi:hypothetical protein